MGARFAGLVVRATGSWYDVELPDGSCVRCRIRGRLRLKGVRSTNPVVAGDRVECERDAAGEGVIVAGEGVIVAVQPRRNYLIRRASNLSKESHIIAANLDQALLVATLFEPQTSLEFIDRFLVTCEAYRVPALLVLNKADLARQRPAELAAFRAVYEGAGYTVLETAAPQGEGIEPLRALLAGRTTLIAGNSGVGKSTLAAALEPGLDIRTGAISQAHRKGRHTTTFSQMYRLSSGGRLIDTPGIKGFGLMEIAPEEVARYFPEMMRAAPGCQFHNCTHTHEPRCAVREAVLRGTIALPRYESYLKMLDDDDKYRK